MDELISRQVAIDDLHGKDPSQIWDTADIEVWINELPSVQPERESGEWIDYEEDGFVECPFCHSATNCDGNKKTITLLFFMWRRYERKI